MIDANKAVRSWLLSNIPVATVVGDRVFGGVLPETYNADQDGLAITVKVRGGSAHEYIPLISPSMQIECWASSSQYLQARDLYLKVFDALHGYNNITIGDTVIMSSVEEVQGQDTTDPDTGWATVVAFFRMTMRATNS